MLDQISARVDDLVIKYAQSEPRMVYTVIRSNFEVQINKHAEVPRRAISRSMPRTFQTTALPFKSMSARSNDSDASWLSQGSCLANLDETELFEEIDGPDASISQIKIDEAHAFLKSFGIAVCKPLDEVNAAQYLERIQMPRKKRTTDILKSGKSITAKAYVFKPVTSSIDSFPTTNGNRAFI